MNMKESESIKINTASESFNGIDFDYSYNLFTITFNVLYYVNGYYNCHL